MFSRFQIAGEVLAIAALSASAVAQNPQARINTITDLEAALQACWVPPPMEQSRPGMQITVLISFKRNGELFGQPRIVFQSKEASKTERSSYRIAVAQTLRRWCVFAVHGGARKHRSRPAVHHDLR